MDKQIYQSAEEVADIQPQAFSKLPNNIKEKLYQRKCENCKRPLKNQSIHYVYTSGRKVRWWDVICIYK